MHTICIMYIKNHFSLLLLVSNLLYYINININYSLKIFLKRSQRIRRQLNSHHTLII